MNSNRNHIINLSHIIFKPKENNGYPFKAHTWVVPQLFGSWSLKYLHFSSLFHPIYKLLLININYVKKPLKLLQNLWRGPNDLQLGWYATFGWTQVMIVVSCPISPSYWSEDHRVVSWTKWQHNFLEFIHPTRATHRGDEAQF